MTKDERHEKILKAIEDKTVELLNDPEKLGVWLKKITQGLK